MLQMVVMGLLLVVLLLAVMFVIQRRKELRRLRDKEKALSRVKYWNALPMAADEED